jgi:hypothetical protein
MSFAAIISTLYGIPIKVGCSASEQNIASGMAVDSFTSNRSSPLRGHEACTSHGRAKSYFHRNAGKESMGNSTGVNNRGHPGAGVQS